MVMVLMVVFFLSSLSPILQIFTESLFAAMLYPLISSLVVFLFGPLAGNLVDKTKVSISIHSALSCYTFHLIVPSFHPASHSCESNSSRSKYLPDWDWSDNCFLTKIPTTYVSLSRSSCVGIVFELLSSRSYCRGMGKKEGVGGGWEVLVGGGRIG